MRVPVVLCVDVEPDARQVPVPGAPSWGGFERLVAALPEIRDELRIASGDDVAIGWFLRMDPQMEVAYGSAGWVVERYGDALASLEAHGDELGVHAHSWSWQGGRWIVEHGDAAWVERCTSSSLAAYRAAFGRRCPSFRGGDRYFDAAIFRCLREHGVGVDLTLEPGAPEVAGLAAGECTTGRIPGVPATLDRPFVPSADDPMVPAAAGHGEALLAVPLTAGPSFLPGRGRSEAVSTTTLTLWSPPHLFRLGLEQRLARPDLAHLAFAIRSDVAGEPVFWPWFRANLRHLANRLGSDAHWCTPSAAASVLRPTTSEASPGCVRWDTVAVGAALEATGWEAELAMIEVAAAGDDARRQLDAVLATRWWRLHDLIERVGRTGRQLSKSTAAIASDALRR